MKKNDSQKQPSKLKEYAAVKILGRRTSNNHLEARYEARNLTSSVLWVELRLLESRFALNPAIIFFEDFRRGSCFLSRRGSLYGV